MFKNVKIREPEVRESLQVRLQDSTADEKNGFAQICPLQICRKKCKTRSKYGAKMINTTLVH